LHLASKKCQEIPEHPQEIPGNPKEIHERSQDIPRKSQGNTLILRGREGGSMFSFADLSMPKNSELSV